MNSTARIAALAIGACFVTHGYAAGECPKPPVRDSLQASCYATSYAQRHGLRHERPLTKRVSKGAKFWTVRFADARPNMAGGGWEVDVDTATGNVTRFRSFKEVER